MGHHTELQGDATAVDGRRRYWLIWIDDTPIGVDDPLTADQVGGRFAQEVADDPTALVEVKQCTREDLDWADITDGIGADEMDDAAGPAQHDLPDQGA